MVSNIKSTKRERFVRLAEARVERGIKILRLIGNLSNRGNYEFSDADVSKILTALENELKELRARFKTGYAKNEITFKL